MANSLQYAMSYRFNLNLWPQEFIEGCASIAAKRRLNIDSVILSIILGTTVFVGKSQIRMVGSDKVDVASLWICNVQVGFSIEAAAAADADADKQTDINQTNTHTKKKMSVANHNALSFFIVIQPSGSNKTELEIVSVMNEIGFPKESLASDATAAALRKQMERSNNNLVTLVDEYRSTLSSRGGWGPRGSSQA